jgi:IS5 family transposase
MTRFRQRIGETGCEGLLPLTIEVGLQTAAITPAHLQLVNANTTVQHKAVAFPTDARYSLKDVRTLVRLAKQTGELLRQSYIRLAVQVFLQHGRYAKAKQRKRAQQMQMKLTVYLSRVYCDVQRKLVEAPQRQEDFRELFGATLHGCSPNTAGYRQTR